jgi:hypothetical protein
LSEIVKRLVAKSDDDAPNGEVVDVERLPEVVATDNDAADLVSRT